MKKILVFCVCLAAAIMVAAGIPYYSSRVEYVNDTSGAVLKDAVVSQHIEAVSYRPKTIYVLYHNGKQCGILHSKQKLQRHLHKLYKEKYASRFPSSSLSLADGYALREELSYFTWNNCDEEILGWLDRMNAYALNAVEIAFSNDQGTYARIYVSDESLYEHALRKYLSCFVDSVYLDQLLSGKTVPMPTDYGSVDVGLNMVETVTTLEAKAPAEKIFTKEDEVLEYLEYGGNLDKAYYTVQEGDTLEAVGEKNGGLSVEQLRAINPDVLAKDSDELTPGERLCITYFESPITVQVYRARLVKESIPFHTDYVQNYSVDASKSIVRKGVDGIRNALYRETWVNGVLEKSEELSSSDSIKAVNQVQAIDQEEDKSIGSGGWQLPVDHAQLSCKWGCEVGYEAVSYKDAYDLWGSVYAVDNGVIESVGYSDEDGNWIKINHLNGMHSCYAHLQEPAKLSEGASIQKGEVIGQIGITGNSTYPHLKFWLEDDNGSRIDPNTVEFPSCPN